MSRRLKAVREASQADLLIVMRVYFEKPRTVTGWKGLINDPDMDGGHDVHRGLRTARRLLLDIVSLGLPVGCEWLDPITPQYIADTVTWGGLVYNLFWVTLGNIVSGAGIMGLGYFAAAPAARAPEEVSVALAAE